MTDQELDRIMRRVLIDSMKAEAETSNGGPHPSFQATSRHQRQMRAMLANPLRWLHRRERPLWKQIARRVAVFFLAVLLLFGGVMALSPSARAAVVRWVERWDGGDRLLFVYSGEQNTEPMPQFEIAALPEGYAETERFIAPGFVVVDYENAEGEVIVLEYVFMHQGALTGFDLDDEDSVFDVQVNSYKGTYFESSIPGNFNALTWMDTDQNMQFTIYGFGRYSELLQIVDGISLCETPN